MGHFYHPTTSSSSPSGEGAPQSCWSPVIKALAWVHRLLGMAWASKFFYCKNQLLSACSDSTSEGFRGTLGKRGTLEVNRWNFSCQVWKRNFTEWMALLLLSMSLPCVFIISHSCVLMGRCETPTAQCYNIQFFRLIQNYANLTHLSKCLFTVSKGTVGQSAHVDSIYSEHQNCTTKH